MLASDFKEGTKKTTTTSVNDPSAPGRDDGVGPSSLGDELETIYFEDSDDEIVQIHNFKRDPSLPQPGSYHPLTVNSMAFTTLRAVLGWIYSSHIEFAPMLSSFSPDKYVSRDEARAERNDKLRQFIAEHPGLPLPSSPKSIYRAAHLLHLPELKRLALESIRAQLKPASVAYELLGDVSTCYEEVRDAELDFAVKHWTLGVRDSTAMKQMETMAETGQLPGAAWTLVKLARRLNT